ncbi:hypothetical protein INR49_015715 [Caranx melampygus]|nr:hypothetical protein INR49_015715 [Caranx melampygus]
MLAVSPTLTWQRSECVQQVSTHRARVLREECEDLPVDEGQQGLVACRPNPCHANLHQGDEDDDQTFTETLLGRDESGTLGAPVALKLGVHPAVDPV